MTNRLPWLADEIERLRSEHLLRVARSVTPEPDGWCRIAGRRLRNLASNDYLNLAQDPRLADAARDAIADAGVGAQASAAVCGRTVWHERLEQSLAEFEKAPRALIFPTGYSANLGTLSALMRADDVVYCDRLNHASLIDGCRLSGARLRVYRHDRLERLERALRKGTTARRRWIVTDSVFSMDGDLAPLTTLCDLSERYDAPLILDEAHGTGVFGEHGRGVAEYQGVEDRVAVRIGTFSKAVGCLGGFVAGSESLVTWLRNRARTQIFSTALPASVCAAACTAIRLIQAEPERREWLLKLATELQKRLQDASIKTVAAAQGPIVPVLLGAPEHALRMAAALEDQGFLVAAIRPPTVPQGTSRLRITLSSAHTLHDVEQLSETLQKLVAK